MVKTKKNQIILDSGLDFIYLMQKSNQVGKKNLTIWKNKSYSKKNLF